MCSINELIVMVVEPDIKELDIICDSLRTLGVQNIICVKEYSEALILIEKDKNVDIVISNINLNTLRNTGIFLCEMAKKTRPDILFLLSSKESGTSFICKSLAAGADGLLHASQLDYLEEVIPKWLHLAIKRRTFNEILEK